MLYYWTCSIVPILNKVKCHDTLPPTLLTVIQTRVILLPSIEILAYLYLISLFTGDQYEKNDRKI